MKTREINLFIVLLLLILFFGFLYGIQRVKGQTLTEIIGPANPLNGFDVGKQSYPCFVDIDNDGDMDMFAGNDGANIDYFENTGTATAPVYVQRFGVANPLALVVEPDRDSAPNLYDMDNDGDYDAFIGSQNGIYYYYENQGTAASPNFVYLTGAANPMDGIDVGDDSRTFLEDLDNDGDFDLLTTDEDETMFRYYLNTGDASTPVFTEQFGANNPLDGIVVPGNGSEFTNCFMDFDNDGDMDMFNGLDDGTIEYYENTGSITSPAYTLISGPGNPLDGVDLGRQATPTPIDMDGDGDLDLVVGDRNGIFHYFEAVGTGVPNPLLPVGLLSFEATKSNAQIHLQWETSSEIDNSHFTVERSKNGLIWEEVTSVNGAGNSTDAIPYEAMDDKPYSGTSYYRLKQIDFNGQFSYSELRAVYLHKAGTAVILYPNPTSGQFRIESSKVDLDELRVYNSYGQIINVEANQDLVNGNSILIDLSRLPEGAYTVMTGSSAHIMYKK